MALKPGTAADKKKPVAVISPQKKEKVVKHGKAEKHIKGAPKAPSSSETAASDDDDTKPLHLWYISVGFLAVAFALFNMYHVSTMFENDRHFSHLSNLEREMTFRTEMGLYYSYYKTLIEASSFADGMVQIIDDNVTEYPSVINTLKRFNLYPEVFIGGAFRVYSSFMAWLQIPAKQCWQVERGGGLKPVLSCEGLGDPMYFYLQAVWVCAGFTAALLFLYGTFLSGSVLGGVITILCFFFNHGESTRVQWTPPLRESFAYPALLFQMLCVSMLLRYKCSSWMQGIGVAVATALSLVTWQFSQFVLATQVVVVMALYAIGEVNRRTAVILFVCIGAGVQHALMFLLGNELLASSFLVCIIVASLVCVLVMIPALEYIPPPIGPLSTGLCLPITAALTLSIRSKLMALLNTSDDAHILNLLRSKVGTYKDFHTMLYTCSAEFDFLPTEYWLKLSKTLLLPSASVSMFAVFVHACASLKDYYLAEEPTPQPAKLTKTPRKESAAAAAPAAPAAALGSEEAEEECLLDVETDILYNIGQTSVFVCMALLVMRLKLMLTPQLCVLASLLASRKYFNVIKDSKKHWVVVVVLLSGMAHQGIQNLREQHSIIGEYSNVHMEQLLEWVKAETPPDAVFAGPMPVMANLLLSTRRPIVNHPHYEDAGLRERTRKVYSVFSRHSAQEVYKTLSQMQVQFLVLEESWCFRESKPGCGMTDIWDMEEPELREQPALCPRLFLQNPAPFERVFSNSEYVVLWLHSQYVELHPRRAAYKL